ncbi:bolA-like family protein [Asticcacaulis biprosthecium C19]|uniref:BolA-like family protein n=1 Tax=Asticcacaulis biprosthecium C19 TaxID=715226 RepID=F4QRT2_9CAUL|nr:BolA family transcriptional regulator [Asticcacaulis biprosthecium]EGF89452.1 bolA-like family protein [Asticcacaulis biprosthecium C19]
MAIAQSELQARIEAAFPDAEVTITDLAGDGDHYKARIVSGAFNGLARVRQHQLVNRALADLLSGPLHALALETVALDTVAKDG